jgi:hypothetical protein
MVSKVFDWLESAAEADASMRCRSPSRRFAKSTDFTAGLYGKIIRNTFTVICCALRLRELCAVLIPAPFSIQRSSNPRTFAVQRLAQPALAGKPVH